jgi:hypothetical protein
MVTWVGFGKDSGAWIESAPLLYPFQAYFHTLSV